MENGPTAQIPTLLIFTHGSGRLGNQLLSHAHLLAFCHEHVDRFSLLNIALSRYRHFLQRGAESFGAVPRSSLATLARAVGFCDAHLQHDGLRHRCVGMCLRLLYALGRNRSDVANLTATDVSGYGGYATRQIGAVDLGTAAAVDLLGTARTVLLSGWRLRSWALLERHGEAIRGAMSPPADCIGRVKEELRSARRSYDMMIGVQIRQGDYATWQDGRYFFPIDRYVAWMRAAAARFAARGRVGFVVTAETPFPPEIFAGLNTHLAWQIDGRRGAEMRDMIRLSQCDLLMIPPTTFGCWASFLGRIPILTLRAADADLAREPILERGIFAAADDRDMMLSLR